MVRLSSYKRDAVVPVTGSTAVLGVTLAALLLVLCGAVSAQPQEYYRGNAGNGDLWANPGASLSFNTTAGTMIGSGGVSDDFAFANEVQGGVQVFRFKNVVIPAGVNVTVQGTRPLVIAADQDMYIGADINVSGGVINRGGGGAGGAGGGGSSGGAGGLGGGGAGSVGGGGQGGGGGGIFECGDNGIAGQFGGNGTPGNQGITGADGQGGSSGYAGFNIQASGPAGGSGGVGGRNLGQGGSGGTGSQSGGAGGSAGCAGGIDGDDGQPGGGGGRGQDGFAGTQGESGGNGVQGSSGVFTISPNTLEVYAGIGGGGGGGGGGAQGGGQGGGGGGGRGGGGGGGGGRGLLGGILNGGAGGRGGNGGQGGVGSSGGSGGAGGAGGKGGNGGGAVILSARGLLQVTTAMTVDISAGAISPGLPGGGSGGVGAFGSGGTGAAGAAGSGGDDFCIPLVGCAEGGDGGAGGRGGDGGHGGTGALGGQGGQGGNGGYGTPGMVKLHGSVMLVRDMTIRALNGRPSSDAEANGKLTLISNMSNAAYFTNQPATLQPASIVSARTTNSEIKGTTVFDTWPDHPHLPNLVLKTGPGPIGDPSGTEGLVRVGDPKVPDYYLRTIVEDPANAPDFQLGDGSLGIIGQRITGGDNVFDQYEQIFVLNNSGGNVDNLFLQVAGGTARKINGTSGLLEAGQIWTTTVRSGATVRLLQTPIIITQPQDIAEFPGASPSMSVTVVDNSGSPVRYQWETNINNVWQSVVDDPRPVNGISGSATSTLQFTNIALPPPTTVVGSYQVRIWNDTGELNSVVSQPARLDIYPAPVIVQHPQDALKFPHATHVFNVAAVGFALNYEWFYAPEASPGTPGPFVSIANALPPLPPAFTDYVVNELSASLFFTDIAIIHEGYYKCTVSNLTGSVTSNHARLGVERAPEIIRQPENITVPMGFTATFELLASGTISSYTWQVTQDPDDPMSWVDVSVSPIDPNLVITNAQSGPHPAGDEGYYRCQVSGAGYVVESQVVTLTVTDPGIIDQPDDRVVNPGQSLNPAFEVVALTAYEPLKYTWYHDGVAVVTDSPDPSLVLNNIQESQEGYYWVVVTNSDTPPGSTTSDQAYLMVRNPPVITDQPDDVITDQGTGIQLSVTASCENSMIYQWFYQPLDESVPMNPILDSDGGRIIGYTEAAPPGEHRRDLVIFPSIATDEGYYQVEVTAAGVGSVLSNRVRVILGTLLTCGVDREPPLESLPCQTPEGDVRVYVNHILQRFTMSTTGGRGTRSYQWLVDREDGSGFVPARPLITSNADPFTAPLDLINVQFSNAGVYYCEASDSRPGVVSTAPVRLDVFPHLGQAILEEGAAVVNVTEGDTYTFHAACSGGMPPLRYEWYKEEGDTDQLLELTTNPELTLEDIQVDAAGSYYVIVRDDGTDVRTSNLVLLEVEPGVPAVSLFGLGLAAGLTALAGASALRRKKQ